MPVGPLSPFYAAFEYLLVLVILTSQDVPSSLKSVVKTSRKPFASLNVKVPTCSASMGYTYDVPSFE